MPEEMLRGMAKLCRGVDSVRHSPLWGLVRTGQLPCEGGDRGYGKLDDAAYWTVREPLVLTNGVRGLTWPVLHMTEDGLVRLAAQGSVDAVAALWMLLLEDSGSERDPKEILIIATYIPPAIALLSLSPVGLRVARLLFARIRQLVLDSLVYDGYQLSLERYDLAKVTETVTGWSPGCIGSANPYKDRRKGAEPTPSAIHDWMERSRAPLRKIRRQPAKPRWRVDLSPSAHTTERRFKLEHLSVMHANAIAISKAELKDYW